MSSERCDQPSEVGSQFRSHHFGYQVAHMSGATRGVDWQSWSRISFRSSGLRSLRDGSDVGWAKAPNAPCPRAWVAWHLGRDRTPAIAVMMTWARFALPTLRLLLLLSCPQKRASSNHRTCRMTRNSSVTGSSAFVDDDNVRMITLRSALTKNSAGRRQIPSFRGAAAGREPGIHNHERLGLRKK